MGVVRFHDVFKAELKAVAARRERYAAEWQLRTRKDLKPDPNRQYSPEQSSDKLSATISEPQSTPELEDEGIDVDGNPIQRPTEQTKLIGLALSGGGVRSAAFCLGALQALDEEKVLGRVDYLSTVSGGGYIGTSMVAAMSET